MINESSSRVSITVDAYLEPNTSIIRGWGEIWDLAQTQSRFQPLATDTMNHAPAITKICRQMANQYLEARKRIPSMQIARRPLSLDLLERSHQSLRRSGNLTILAQVRFRMTQSTRTIRTFRPPNTKPFQTPHQTTTNCAALQHYHRLEAGWTSSSINSPSFAKLQSVYAHEIALPRLC